MEKYVGFITADAVITEVNGKKVVKFSIAVNRKFKTSAGQLKEKTRFFECSHWSGSKLAPFLLKGKLVEVIGETDARAYVGKSTGKAVPILTINVAKLQLYSPKSKGETRTIPSDEQTQATPNFYGMPGNGSLAPETETAVAKDDLPF